MVLYRGHGAIISDGSWFESRPRGRHPRQPDRGGQSGADDHRNARRSPRAVRARRRRGLARSRGFRAGVRPRHPSIRREALHDAGRAESTAIAGLSMGGAPNTRDRGAASQGFRLCRRVQLGRVGGNGPGRRRCVGHTARGAARRQERARIPRALWFATGKDDFLLPTTNATVALLEKHGLHPIFHGSDGGHVWANWRDYCTNSRRSCSNNPRADALGATSR